MELRLFLESLKHDELNPIIPEYNLIKALDWIEKAFQNKQIDFVTMNLLREPIEMALNYYIEKEKESESYFY